MAALLPEYTFMHMTEAETTNRKNSSSPEQVLTNWILMTLWHLNIKLLKARKPDRRMCKNNYLWVMSNYITAITFQRKFFWTG